MVDFASTPREVPASSQHDNPTQAPHTTAHALPIEGSIDSGSLGSGGFGMLRRLLMRGATALGLESSVASPTPTPDSGTEANSLDQSSLSLVAKLKRALLESRLVRDAIHLGESLVSLAYGLWEKATGSDSKPKVETGRDERALRNNVYIDTETHRATIEPPLVAIEVIKSLDEKRDTQEELVSAALQQCADAVRNEHEKKLEAITHEEQVRAERTQHARELIEMIDAQGGSIANNPKVQAILNSLGTPYDSVGQAIAQVYALQKEEEELDVH